MKFAFLVHPLSEETKALLHLDDGGALRKVWSNGGNLLEFCDKLSLSMSSRGMQGDETPIVRVIDEMPGLLSQDDSECEGRLYEIPMHVSEILDDPSRAMGYMEQAVDAAAEWGADLVGLGSMTGIVGGQGQVLAERGPVPVTTGNSLTAYAALQAVENACHEAELNIEDEVVAVVGIPGSIATVVARLLRPRCRELILVARRNSSRANKLKKELDADLVLDSAAALAKASIVVSATSTGGCIQQSDLRPGTVVVDVGVPADVDGSKAERDDVLILSGGLALTPSSMSRESMWLGFHHGMVPCCLGETMTLALEGRAECYTIGRDLSPDGVIEIGEIARRHGFDFSPLISFGLPVKDSTLTSFKKALYRSRRTLQACACGELLPAKSVQEHNCQCESLDQSNGSNGIESNGSSNGNGRHADARHGSNGHHSGNGSTQTELPSQEKNSTAEAARREAENQSRADRAEVRHSRYINPVMVALSGNSGFVRTFVRGEGCYVWDRDGNRLLDFVSGFGSMNVGHNHPRVAGAIQDALATQAVGFAQSGINPYAAALAERLVSISPAGLEMAFFTNSGTESVEAALKLARISTKRRRFLYCHRSYHGKSFGSLSVTGNPNYQGPFGPLLPECDAVDYGDLKALERHLRDKQHAAFIVEPLQGEGGMVVPPAEYLSKAAEICRAHGTLLIVDEVQTGLGRTGEMFASDRYGIEPDVLTLAKSLGGGMMPIGAMLARRDLWNKAYGSVQNFALHTSTFGGGSLACAAAMAAIDVITEEGLVENAQARGEQLVSELHKLQQETGEFITEIRGEGLMVGIEFAPLRESIGAHWRQSDKTGMMQYMVPDLDRHIAEVPALFVMQTLLKRSGIYAQVARSRGNVLRVQPPLTITSDQITTFVEGVRSACLDLQATSCLVDGIISKSVSGHHDGSKDQPPASPTPGVSNGSPAAPAPGTVSLEPAVRRSH